MERVLASKQFHNAIKSSLQFLREAKTETEYGIYSAMMRLALAEIYRISEESFNSVSDEYEEDAHMPYMIDLTLSNVGENIGRHIEFVLDLLALELVWLQVIYTSYQARLKEKNNMEDIKEIDFLEKLRRKFRYIRKDADSILKQNPEIDWIRVVAVHLSGEDERNYQYIG